MKIIATLSILPSGYGHNQLIVGIGTGQDREKYTYTTNNTMLTDKIKGAADDDIDAIEAKKEAIAITMTVNGFPMRSEDVEFYNSSRYGNLFEIEFTKEGKEE